MAETLGSGVQYRMLFRARRLTRRILDILLIVDERPGLKQTGLLEEKFSPPNCSLNHKRLKLNSVCIYSLGSKLRLIFIKLPTGFGGHNSY